MRRAVLALALLALPWPVGPVAAAGDPPEPPPYRDDRSTAAAVVESLYNAVARKEYLRAWSYFRDEPDRPSPEAFAAGYKATRSVRLKLGETTGDGAAGSIFYAVPAVVEATADGGGVEVYRGCYELRLVQPAVQEIPPFQPIGIVKGRLEPTDLAFEAATGVCPKDGLP